MVAQTNTQFDLLRAEIADLRTEMREGFAVQRDELGRRIDDTRRDILNGFIAIFVAQIALFSLLLAQALI